MYINKLDDIVDKYNNTFHRTIKMKPFDVKSSAYIDYGLENNDKDSKFKIGDHTRISKYKNIFAKDYTSNWLEEVFILLTMLQILYHGRMFLVILTVKKLLERFMKNNFKRQTPNLKTSSNLKK